MSEINIAVVGCGRMGKIRAAAAAKCNASVAFVCDADNEIAAAVGSQYDGCKVVNSFEDINWSGVSAVFVCTPPHERVKVVLRSIENGVPFLIEKPVGVSEDQVAAIKNALASNPVVSAVGYMNRYRNSIQSVHRDLAGKKILGGTGNWVNGKYKVSWWAQKAMSGGPVNEQATHLVDLARFLIGDVVEVQALGHCHTQDWNEPDTASFQLRFANGALFTAFYSCAASSKMIGLRVFTDETELRLDGWDFQRTDCDEIVDGSSTTDKNAIFDVETKAFLNAACENDLSADNGVLVDFTEACKTQRVVDALHESITSNQIVRIEFD